MTLLERLSLLIAAIADDMKARITGPGSAVDGQIPAFDGASGKLLKSSIASVTANSLELTAPVSQARSVVAKSGQHQASVAAGERYGNQFAESGAAYVDGDTFLKSSTYVSFGQANTLNLYANPVTYQESYASLYARASSASMVLTVYAEGGEDYVEAGVEIGETSAKLKFSGAAFDFEAAGVRTFSLGLSGQFGIGPSRDYGTAGQVLTSNGPSAAPSWTTPAAGGGSTNVFVQETEPTVTGPYVWFQTAGNEVVDIRSGYNA